MPNPNLCDTSALTFGNVDLTEDCNCNEQFTRIAFARRSWLDLDSMSVDAEGCVTSIVMQEQGFFEITGIDSDFVTYTATLDSDLCRYDNTFTIDTRSLSKALRLLVCNMESFCDWVIWGSTTACRNYLLGIEDLGMGALGSSFTSRVTQHDINLGGTTQVQNLIGFTWRSFCEGGQTLVDYDNLPLV